MTAKNGGPAFPIVIPLDDASKYCEGLTKREYFAGKALASGLCPFNSHDLYFCARWAYQMADIMLAESERGGAA